VDRPAKNWLEWAVFAVGMILVLATLGFLVRESLVASGGTAEVVVRLGSPKPSAGGFMVPVEVENAGQGTAEDVKVTVVLETSGAEPEEAELDIAFLPRDSRRNGWVTFRNDPGRGSLRLGPITFEDP
jgi:uncharacterized protein (TIGR02588 family)